VAKKLTPTGRAPAPAMKSRIEDRDLPRPYSILKALKVAQPSIYQQGNS